MKLYAKLSVKKGKNSDEPENIVAIMGDSGADANRNKASSVYNIPAVSHEVKFVNPDYHLDNGEWFYVKLDESSKEEIMGQYLSIIESPSVLNEIIKDQMPAVECIVGSDGKAMIFTKITPSYRIHNKYIIGVFNAGVVVEKYDKSIDFDPHKIDAYFDGESKLYFKNYSVVRGMFVGIDRFYRSAKIDEIQEFLDWDLINIVGEKITAVGISKNRLLAPKIASIMDDDNLNLKDAESKRKTISTIVGIGEDVIGLSIENNKIIVSNTLDLRKVCDVLLGCYYKSPINGENRRTKASIKI